MKRPTQAWEYSGPCAVSRCPNLAHKVGQSQSARRILNFGYLIAPRYQTHGTLLDAERLGAHMLALSSAGARPNAIASTGAYTQNQTAAFLVQLLQRRLNANGLRHFCSLRGSTHAHRRTNRCPTPDNTVVPMNAATLCISSSNVCPHRHPFDRQEYQQDTPRRCCGTLVAPTPRTAPKISERITPCSPALLTLLTPSV